MEDKWFNKGNKLFSKSKLSRAVDAFKRDLALNPSRKVSYLKIALSYNKLQMIDEAREYYNKALELDLQDKVKIINGNLFDTNISQANVITLYLTTSANRKIREKLELELKPGTRIVSHDYEIPGWKPYKVDKYCENTHLGYPTHTIYVYHR